MRSRFFLFLLLGIILNLSLRVYFHRANYLTKYDPQYWHDRYLKSQWVTPNSKESIGDDGLYAYSGWQYIHGRDPSLLNPEMPPLGKYIIGVTIALFGNQNIQALFFGGAVLLLFYHLARLFLSPTLSLFAVYLFTLEPIFAGQISVSLLDLPELTFLLASLLSFLKFLKSKKWPVLCLSLFFLGAMMAVKFFLIAFFLGLTYFLVLLFLKERKFLIYLFLLTPAALTVYLFSYTGYFLNGHSFREFLGLQKWIVVFYQNSLAFAFPGGPFWMMLFNRWESWFGGIWYRDHVIISTSDWQPMWPIVLLLTIILFIKLLKERKFGRNYLNQARLTLVIWVFIYLLLLSTAPIFPRYLLLVLPVMYILSLDIFFNLEFWKTLKILLKKEWRYRKNYLYLFVFSLLSIFWGISAANSGNFIFSPSLARDLSLTRNIIFGLTPLAEPPLSESFKAAFLSLPYFLADGKPQTLFIFLMAAPVVITWIGYWLLRGKSKKLALFLIFPISFIIFSFYQLAWETPIFSSLGKKEFLFKNEKEVLDFTYRDSEIFRFGALPLNNKSATDHYRFLYQWGETRRWRGKNVPLSDNEMYILYVILEPGYKTDGISRQKITKEYKVKFRFDQNFSSGVTVWKFDRLIKTEDNKKAKNE